jgi:hypothetical protein
MIRAIGKVIVGWSRIGIAHGSCKLFGHRYDTRHGLKYEHCLIPQRPGLKRVCIGQWIACRCGRQKFFESLPK